MLQVRPVFVREAALLLAELADKAQAGREFALALDERSGRSAPVGHRRPQPDRASGFGVHAFLPEGPERPAPRTGFAAYTARLAERIVFEGPVAGLSLSV